MLKTLPSEQFQNFVPKSHLLFVTSNYGTELWSLPAGEKIAELVLPFAFGHQLYLPTSGDRFAVVDSAGLRDFSIYPQTDVLVGATQQYSSDDLSSDDRYSSFFK
jgi:hypothetical protein